MEWWYGLYLICITGYCFAQPIWFEPQASLSDIEAALQSGQNKDIDARNNLGQTGLMFAINMSNFGAAGTFGNRMGLVELLVKYGANVNAQSLKSPREEDFSFDNTPLHYVAIQPNYQATIPVLNFLIDAGARINMKNSLGETPLMWTANLALLEDKTNITKEFIANLADVNMQNNIGDTYLHILIRNRDSGMVQVLLHQFGSMFDLTIKNVEGQTPLDLARNTLEPDSTRFIEVVHLIGGADDVKTTDILGHTGLMLAIIRNDLTFAQRQIEKGAEVNMHDRTRFANTPLHFAVLRTSGSMPFITLLLNHKVDLNSKGFRGNTPLHYLVLFNMTTAERDEIARTLINAGANPHIKNRAGNSVVDIAKARDNNFARMLEEWYKHYQEAKKKLPNS